MQTFFIALATVIGPIAAVVITRLMDDRKAREMRRYFVFSTLMALRGQSIHAEHVRALNLVQLEFAKNSHVINSWRNFINHVETDATVDPTSWNMKYRDLLNQLLVDIAKDLKIQSNEIDLARGGYYPRGWAFQEERIQAAQEFVHGLSSGTKAVPVKLVEAGETALTK